MPRRARRGRGHQLWRAVLGNPIPMNFTASTTIRSWPAIQAMEYNCNDTRPAPQHGGSHAMLACWALRSNERFF